LRQLWPLPAGLEDRLRRYKKVVCAEMNSGQLTSILRATHLLPVEPVTQVTGRPFTVSTLEEMFSQRLAGGVR
jgi:2-oxoglutarate ferredoxin oxidoreductase subunit alpha